MSKNGSVPGDALAALVEPPVDSTPDTVDSVAFARLYGEPLFQMPTDLYIPPDALEIFLEAFEGPLDLLLYLIRKQNFNVLDIPMADVTRQYLSYVDQIRIHNLELAAEYLLMAAMLIEIKSRMLLPVRKTDTGEARGPARRTGPPPARVRADEAGGAEARRHAPAGPRFRQQPRRGRPERGAHAARGRRGRPARGLGRHHEARPAQPAPPHHARTAVRARPHDPYPEAPERRALHGVRRPLHGAHPRRRARGRGRCAFHRHARAGPRIAAGDHAGRALRADLRAPGLHERGRRRGSIRRRAAPNPGEFP